MLLQAAQHNQYWSDLLSDLEGISWPRIISILMSTNHGFSNYEKCKKRDHTQVRQDVYRDKKVLDLLARDPDNAKRKVEKILDEMCHLLAIQTTPTRRLKWTGAFFMKCITRIYSSIYVNTHLSSSLSFNQLFNESSTAGIQLFKEQFQKISNKMPVVILPTHRSYMDFLFITYVMFINELPLPIVAAGDNFKALGSLLTNYLKSTGAFLIRRNAGNNKTDIGANDYYDILRAYVHSVVEGGENPIEFFMEGTRTRLGQVLRPKTGLLSMVVDMFLEGQVEDICILPVTINYQRPIEEQLYIKEMTPQISGSKPKETASNLLAAYDKIMRRNYGKVYVRFLEPFKLSDFHKQYMSNRANKSKKNILKKNNSADQPNNQTNVLLHELTNNLATKVCLAQANSNVLMPFNLMSYSILARSFLASGEKNKPESHHIYRIAIKDITNDFLLLEDLLRNTRSDFVPGWRGHLDILDEFKLDRDGFFWTTDRNWIEFGHDARTFHTFSYYANQVMQILLPIAITLLLTDDASTTDLDLVLMDAKTTKLEQYIKIRSLISKEFLVDEMSIEKEFHDSLECIEKGFVRNEAKAILLNYLRRFFDSYINFLQYCSSQCGQVIIKTEFLQATTPTTTDYEIRQFISKDMVNNMISLVKDLEICRTIDENDPKSKASTSKRREEQLVVESEEKLDELLHQFQELRNRINQSLSSKQKH